MWLQTIHTINVEDSGRKSDWRSDRQLHKYFLAKIEALHKNDTDYVMDTMRKLIFESLSPTYEDTENEVLSKLSRRPSRYLGYPMLLQPKPCLAFQGLTRKKPRPSFGLASQTLRVDAKV